MKTATTVTADRGVISNVDKNPVWFGSPLLHSIPYYYIPEEVGDNKNVSELNKRNSDPRGSGGVSSDNYFIPYGDKSRTQDSASSDIINNKPGQVNTEAKTDHATKTMHCMLQGK